MVSIADIDLFIDVKQVKPADKEVGEHKDLHTFFRGDWDIVILWHCDIANIVILVIH